MADLIFFDRLYKTKRILAAVLSGLILMLFLQSCCKPASCEDQDKIGEIRFQGYALKDIKDTKIVKYKKSTSLTAVIDTFFVNASMLYSYANNAQIGIPAEKDYIDVNYDYKLILNAGAEYTLTDFTLESKEVSGCNFFNKSCWYLALISYKVNGQIVNKSVLEIIK